MPTCVVVKRCFWRYARSQETQRPRLQPGSDCTASTLRLGDSYSKRRLRLRLFSCVTCFRFQLEWELLGLPFSIWQQLSKNETWKRTDLGGPKTFSPQIQSKSCNMFVLFRKFLCLPDCLAWPGPAWNGLARPFLAKFLRWLISYLFGGTQKSLWFSLCK